MPRRTNERDIPLLDIYRVSSAMQVKYSSPVKWNGVHRASPCTLLKKTDGKAAEAKSASPPTLISVSLTVVSCRSSSWRAGFHTAVTLAARLRVLSWRHRARER